MAVNKLVDGTQLDSDLTSVANAIRLKGSTSASLSFPSGFVSAINALPSGGSSLITKSITANGTYNAQNDSADGYSQVTVNVSVNSSLITKNITANGIYSAQDDNVNGYSQVTVNVSGGSVAQKSVIFIDYDGTELYEYTADEANALTELPTVPNHEDMVSQGWNHTLEQIKADVAKGAVCIVGPMYTTEATVGTRLYCRFKNPNFLSPKLGIGPNNGSINIDWGDGSTIDNLSGSSLTTLKQKQHTYATIGNYTIKLVRNEDTARFGLLGNSDNGSILNDNNHSTIYPASIYKIMFGGDARIYQSCFKGLTHLECINTPSHINDYPEYMFSGDLSLKAFVIPLREGRTHTIGNSAFSGCQSLKYVSLSKTVKTIGSSAFYNCKSLESINIPDGLTSISVQLFRDCTSLKYVNIPNTVTSIGSSAFYGCQALESIYLPAGITSINDSTFRDCQSLKIVNIPDAVTSIRDYAFSGCKSLESITIPNGVTSIGDDAFYQCHSLKYVSIPNSVTSIGGYVFANCESIDEYNIMAEIPPTLGSSALSCPGDCVIYIPYSADHSILTAYQTAQNWSTYANRMVEKIFTQE